MSRRAIRVPGGFWIKWLRAAGAFSCAVLGVAITSGGLGWFGIVYLAFPVAVINIYDKSEVAVSPIVSCGVWLCLAALFALAAWREPLRWVVLYSVVAVVACLGLFRMGLYVVGYVVRVDSL
jgi:hypothetical protein